jgi:uncharacterized protein (DUF983 family)
MKGKCPNCGSELPIGWSETVCSKCGRRYNFTLHKIFITLILASFVTTILLLAVYTQDDFLTFIALPLSLMTMSAVLLLMEVKQRKKNKSLTLAKKKPMA